ncbi:hypothetical protein [Neobacillus niacini]|jgi:hypothetical protein|uniref:hypothetical protein n=1 Tax=Neobacillus niacini TaxID=86668 RepID=UPI001C8E439A|nr:hypothetical protein [Neobacillus niacini]MBY0148601.1 hypothetical protein [Neobacillus niacini]
MGLVEKALKVINENKASQSSKAEVSASKLPLTLNKKLIFEKEEDKKAYESGWVIGVPGEVYEIMLNRFSSIFILKQEEERFDVVRLTWLKGKKTPFLEKYKAKNVPFSTALELGNKYINRLVKVQK